MPSYAMSTVMFTCLAVIAWSVGISFWLLVVVGMCLMVVVFAIEVTEA